VVRVCLAVLALVAAGSLTAGAGGSVSGSALKVKTVDGSIEAIAMDGPRVAYDASGRAASGRCNRLFVWNVLTGTGSLVSGRGTCSADSPSTGAGVRELAIAGTRLAWVVALNGASVSDDILYTASLPNPRERKLASALRSVDSTGVASGDWIGGVVGSGTVLVVNSWTTDAKGAVAKAALQTIGSAGLKPIVSGTGSITARSADLDRIAVLRSDGTVAVYSALGVLLRAITPSSVKEIALRQDFLVVLTKTKALEIYNANTGSLVNTWPVSAAAGHLDVHSGIAVYSAGRGLHAVRLMTGKDVVVATAKRSIQGDEIEAPGAVYSFNTVRGARDIGNVAFVPMTRVIAAVS
jgi:hypothetical protein